MTIQHMTEAELLNATVKRCQDWGLLWYHSYDYRRVKMAGWPDLVIVGHGILFRELKSASGSVSADQAAWRRALQASDGNWAVWRPADLESGRIDRELRQLTICALPYHDDDGPPAL
jgi:hypothetical protein